MTEHLTEDEQVECRGCGLFQLRSQCMSTKCYRCGCDVQAARLAPVIASQMAERPKLYYRVTFPHGYTAVLDPGEKDEFIKCADEPPTSIENIYLTDAEYEALPEFES